jgi:methylglutamate dehydrogenase subunit C
MGVEVCGVIDVRADAPRSLDYEVLHGQVVDTKGRLGLNQVKIRLENGNIRSLDCGALGVSGGWNPNVHLTCHQRGRPTWRDDIAAFVPGVDLPLGMSVAGAASGIMSTTGALQSGTDAACAH